MAACGEDVRPRRPAAVHVLLTYKIVQDSDMTKTEIVKLLDDAEALVTQWVNENWELLDG